MLKVDNLSRSYGDFLAVNNVSFNIGAGEIVGLLGHNGAGKTTIMKMISGYLEPDDGTVEVNDIHLSDNPKVIQSFLGYLPENLPVYPEMSVADYLDYAADLKGLTGKQKSASIRQAVIATEIQEKLISPIFTLSRGFKQRVGVAQAILGNPKLLILDEPTNGLDPTQTEHMRNLIRELAKSATVILSTHIMQEVEALCDRVLIVNAGELAVDEKMDDLKEGNIIQLSCSLAPDSLTPILDSVGSIASTNMTNQSDDAFEYLLNTNNDCSQKELCSAIAKAVIESGANLYGLHGKAHDLEALFREVNEGRYATKQSTTAKKEEVNHAA